MRPLLEPLGRFILPSGEVKLLTERGIAIGRERGNDIWLVEPTVSRRHAVVRVVEGNAYIEDLGSFNGTFVNGERVKGPHVLRDGDRIDIEQATLLFYLIAAAAEPPPPPADVPSITEEPAAKADDDDTEDGVVDNQPPSASPPVASPVAVEPAAVPSPVARPPDPVVQRPPASLPLEPAAVVARNPAAEPARVAQDPAPRTDGAWVSDGITRHRFVDLGEGRRAAEVAPIGALTIETAEAFHRFVAQIASSGAASALLDLSELSYVDSTGLGELIQLRREMTARGGTVRLFGVTADVQRIFELTNLHKVLTIDTSRADALAAVAAR